MINGHHKRWPFWLSISVLLLLFIYLIRSVLLPFVLGIFIAYFLHPAARRLEKTGLSRTLATLLLIGLFFSSITLISVIVVPLITNQLAGLVQAVPDYVSQFETKYVPLLSHWFGVPRGQVSVKTAATTMSGDVVKLAGEFATGLLYSGVALIHILSLILITPVVAFYLLRDWQILIARLDKLLPLDSAPTIREQVKIIDHTLSGFVRGQLNVCLILAAYYAIGLTLAGLKFGVVIGMATGLLVVFPYVGLMLGMTIGLGVAFFQFQDYGSVAAVLAVFLTGAGLESTIITPRLVGGKVGLHPVWIIFGMLSGGALFGLVGVLLAVPTTAVIGVLIRFAMQRYMQSEYYRSEDIILTDAPPG